jgi:predicted nucleic acid-binding protein
MILLDTNIISEFMRPTPQTQVMQWLHQQALTDLFISSVTVTEVMYGLK